MVDGIRPVQDIFGGGRLADVLQQRQIRREQQPLRELQLRSAQLGVQGLADIAAQRGLQDRFRQAFAQKPADMSNTAFAVDFYQREGRPDIAQQAIESASKQIKGVAELSGAKAAELFNRELAGVLGTGPIEFAGESGLPEFGEQFQATKDGQPVIMALNKRTGAFEVVPGSKGVAIGAPEQPAAAPTPELKDVLSFRKQVNTNPIVKDFLAIDSQTKRLNEAVTDVEEQRKTGQTPSFIAVDQALITILNKMLDPTSVVRESEYARTPGDQAALSRVKGKFQQLVVGGTSLTDDERNAVVRMARRFSNVARRRLEPEVESLKRVATKFNVDFQDVISPTLLNIQDEDQALFSGARPSPEPPPEPAPTQPPGGAVLQRTGTAPTQVLNFDAQGNLIP